MAPISTHVTLPEVPLRTENDEVSHRSQDFFEPLRSDYRNAGLAKCAFGKLG